MRGHQETQRHKQHLADGAGSRKVAFWVPSWRTIPGTLIAAPWHVSHSRPNSTKSEHSMTSAINIPNVLGCCLPFRFMYIYVSSEHVLHDALVRAAQGCDHISPQKDPDVALCACGFGWRLADSTPSARCIPDVELLFFLPRRARHQHGRAAVRAEGLERRGEPGDSPSSADPARTARAQCLCGFYKGVSQPSP